MTIDERNKQIMQDTRATPFNKERFINLIRATEGANPEDFSMLTYGWGDNDDGHTCGSPACVLGNYAARQDLHRVFVLESLYLGAYPMIRLNPTLGDATGRRPALSYTDAVICDHFGITMRESDELFAEEGCGGAGNDKNKAVAYLRSFYKRITGEYAP
jgi:hypothetical protein